MAAALLPSAAMLAGCGEQVGQPALTLVYRAEVPEDAEPARQAEMLEAAARALRGRLPFPGNVTSKAEGQIVVTVNRPFSREQLPQLRHTLEKYAPLQFQILATPWEHSAALKAAEASEGDDVCDEQGRLLARWVPLRPGLTLDDFPPSAQVVHREVPNPRGGPHTIPQVLVAVGAYDLSGEHVEYAMVDTAWDNRPAVVMHLTEEGGKRMARLTQRYQPLGDTYYHLAIVYNGRIYSAPAIRAVIKQDVMIESDFTQRDQEQLVARFRAGGLPCPVTLLTEQWHD